MGEHAEAAEKPRTKQAAGRGGMHGESCRVGLVQERTGMAGEEEEAGGDNAGENGRRAPGDDLQ